MTDTGTTSAGSTGVARPLVIVGPTASGKSSLAMAIARRLRDTDTAAEIVSGDSMQVYRGMDIGTAKPSPADLEAVPHHLIDVVDPSEEFSVAAFVETARSAIEDIARRGGASIVVGGTGLYVQSLVDGATIPGQYPETRVKLEAEPDTGLLYERITAADPVAASRMEPTNRRRIIRALEVTIGSGRPFSSYGPGMDSYPPTDWTMIGIDMDRTVLTDRIRGRFNAQIATGFLDEVETLFRRDPPLSRTAQQALGYKELTAHVVGDLSLDEAIELAVVRTRRFAVRQIRWFRRDPRITWLSYTDDPTELVEPVISLWSERTAGGPSGGGPTTAGT